MTPAGQVSSPCRSRRLVSAARPGSRAHAGVRACEDRAVVPADIHDFFLGSAGVAGTLIGLLFVAVSVVGERLAQAEASAQVHRIRAYAALTAFINALTVSLFSLIPGDQIGTPALIVACIGLAFVAGALLSLARQVETRRWTTVRDALFLVGLAVTFVFQLISALDVSSRPGDEGSVETLASLVIVCFLLGIAQAWVLIGGPSIGLAHEMVALVRDQHQAAGRTHPAGAPEPDRDEQGPGPTGDQRR